MLIRKYAASVLLTFGALLCSSFIPGEYTPVQKQRLKTIVIDAGHGGSDHGASGAFSKEKDVALAISLKLAARMKEEMPDIDIVMTRTTDIFDDPRRKAQIANEAKGDLFICIHANAAPAIRHREFIGYREETYYKGKGKKRKKYTRKVKEYRTWTTPNPSKGTETFIYGVAKAGAAKAALEEHENLYLDSAAAQELKEMNSDDPAKRMILNMKAQNYFARSASLALTIEEEFQKVGRVSREAQQRQKGIWVLQAVAMPAVLVETGFISNPEEEEYINSDSGQKEICETIIRSVKRYRFSLEKQGSGGNISSAKGK